MNNNFYEFFFFSPGKIIAFACLSISLSSVLLSCNIINPAEPVPAYIHVESFSLTTDTLIQGSSSSNIKDVWVYLDNNILGTFELPANFPVLASGNHTLTLRAGIFIDGIAASRTAYPFYSGFDTTINFTSEKTEYILPKIKYNSSTKFRIEDFDQSGVNLVVTSRSDTSLTTVQNQNSLEGKSGVAYLDDAHQYFECAWKDSFQLPLSTPSYIELDYKSDNSITVGLRSYIDNVTYNDDIVIFKPTSAWKKEYISLGPILEHAIGASGFKIYIYALKETGLSTATIYLDNVKVVY